MHVSNEKEQGFQPLRMQSINDEKNEFLYAYLASYPYNIEKVRQTFASSTSNGEIGTNLGEGRLSAPIRVQPRFSLPPGTRLVQPVVSQRSDISKADISQQPQPELRYWGSNSENAGQGEQSRPTMAPTMGSPEAVSSNDQGQSTFTALRPEDQQFYGKLINDDLNRVEEQFRQNINSLPLSPDLRETVLGAVHAAVQAVRPPAVLPPDANWLTVKTAAEQLNTSQSTIQRAIAAGYVAIEKREVIVPRKMEMVGVRREGLPERINRYQEDHPVGRPKEEFKLKI